MIDGARTLGLVTARGGSKGLPGKNLRDLCGRPLIAWSIDAALRSDAIDDLVVSTDSPEIAEVAQRSRVSPAPDLDSVVRRETGLDLCAFDRQGKGRTLTPR